MLYLNKTNVQYLESERALICFVKAELSSSLNDNCSHWMIEVEGINYDKLTFTSHHGLNGFVQISFGIKLASKTFRQSTNVALPPER